MNKTRNLFILDGKDVHTSAVLDTLHFKGLIAVPQGTNVSDLDIEVAFRNNKSIVCASSSYQGKYLSQAINIQICTEHASSRGHPEILVDSDYAVEFEHIALDRQCDIGDHKSNSSGLNGAPSIKDCAYCRYLAGNPADNERTVYSSKNFFVIPTVGQFTKGSLLVIPYNHIVSIAELDPSLLYEFTTVLEDVEYLIKLTYKCPSVLVWENGTGSGGIGKAKDSIVHAHVHIYPSSLTFDVIEQESGFDFETITLEDLKNYPQYSYLLIRSQDPSVWKINNNPELYIPRQYVRQLVAEEHHVPGDGWNWRTNYFSKNMYDTVEEICCALKENWNDIPERIKSNTSFLF